MALTNTDYIQLRKEAEKRGLLNYTPAYYAFVFPLNILLLAVIYAAVFYFNNWYVTILMSIPISFIGMQFAYLGHEAGHLSISKSPHVNELVGYFSHSFILGGSFSYWKYKHDIHHAYPNHEDIDPDVVDRFPFSYSEKHAKQSSGLSRLITRYQAFLLLPAFLIVTFLMRFDSIKYMLKNRKGVLIDVLLMFMHIAFFLIFSAYFLGLMKSIILYIIVSMLLGIYFGFSFSPNHVGMPILRGDERLSYMEKQIVTSRDVKCAKSFDFIFGGLNYQIEHHLFPNISRKNLRRIKTIVKEFCMSNSLSYRDSTLTETWKDIFAYLNEIGKHAKRLNILKTVEDMV